MELLLDTHSLLWFIYGSPKLSEGARELIENTDNKAFVSIASLWEMAIKISKGNLSIDFPLEHFISDQVQANGITLLEIKPPHLAKVIEIPFHHKDPFDRLIIAQSMVEDFPVVGNDGRFDDYEIQRLW